MTSGRTVETLYEHWAVSSPWNHSNIKYFFGVELCIPPEHPESNYVMAPSSLFPMGLPEKIEISTELREKKPTIWQKLEVMRASYLKK